MDLGCGDAALAQKFLKKVPQETTENQKFEFKLFKNIISIDLVASQPYVTKGDMANTGLESSAADFCIFSLSLMGVNYKDFLKEGARILKIGGVMVILEITSRMPDTTSFSRVVENYGMNMVQKKDLGGYFVFFVFKKKKEVNLERINSQVDWAQLLKPCEYKKR